jgi:hypothetical protein
MRGNYLTKVTIFSQFIFFTYFCHTLYAFYENNSRHIDVSIPSFLLGSEGS